MYFTYLDIPAEYHAQLSCKDQPGLPSSEVDYSNLLNILLSPAKPLLTPTGLMENFNLELVDH